MWDGEEGAAIRLGGRALDSVPSDCRGTLNTEGVGDFIQRIDCTFPEILLLITKKCT